MSLFLCICRRSVRLRLQLLVQRRGPSWRPQRQGQHHWQRWQEGERLQLLSVITIRYLLFLFENDHYYVATGDFFFLYLDLSLFFRGFSSVFVSHAHQRCLSVDFSTECSLKLYPFLNWAILNCNSLFVCFFQCRRQRAPKAVKTASLCWTWKSSPPSNHTALFAAA